MSGEAAYLHELAEVIGPRPATTDAEARAADYIEGVFSARGLDVERQEFDCPRTRSWTYVAYHVATLAAAVASGFQAAIWPALAVSAGAALLMWRELDTRPSLSSIMPKGPSQNVIARYVPKARRGERVLRVVLVAHYDSARASLAFSPGMVKSFQTLLRLTKWCTFSVPVLVLGAALPFAGPARPWLWYTAIAASAPLLVPLLIDVHRETLLRPVDGANDNASGVAAMLGVMERVVPEPESDADVFVTQPFRHVEAEVVEADVVPEGALLTYSPAEAPAAPPARAFEEDFATDEFTWGDLAAESERSQDALRLEEPSVRDAMEPEEYVHVANEQPGRRGVREWLGVRGNFDAREEGERIGSWDNFDDEDEEGGYKGGAAEIGSLDDPGFAASEAARIRRRVTGGVDRGLAEKEIWFVATGAGEAGAWGMRALLGAYADDLKDAVIVNIDSVGAGSVHWVAREGMARRRQSDRRVVSAARRVVGDEGLPVRSREYLGLSTDASAALARGFRAMSVMAFDINGRSPNWHWHSDTVDNVDEDVAVATADFVTSVIRVL